MKRIQTTGIILRRVDYGEADRVITFITPDRGKVSALAKGVRKIKSKLAGGIELFSESHLTFLEGKGELDHVISTRFIKHYGSIITDYDRLQLGYTVLELVNKVSREGEDAGLYNLTKQALQELDELASDLSVTELWFRLGFLKILGHKPNLEKDTKGNKLTPEATYALDIKEGSFAPSPRGPVTADHIKAWRLLLGHTPRHLHGVSGLKQAAKDTLRFAVQLTQYHV